MMRRLIFAIALARAASPALAADVVSAWVRQLTLDGYEEMTISRTWLGRIRIVAEKGDVTREIILNNRTGEILRDYSQNEKGSLQLPLGFTVKLGDDDDHQGGGHAENENSEDSPDGGEEDEDDEKDEGDEDEGDEDEDEGDEDEDEDD